MKFLTTCFFGGLLVIVPVAATVWIVHALVVALDDLAANVLSDPIPGTGLVLALCLVTVIGAIARTVLGGSLLGLLEMALTRLPLVRLLYSSIKDLIGAFVGEEKRFNKPAVVTLVEGGHAKALGFITRDQIDFDELEDHIAVYFPQSYNFAGSLLLFPRDQVRPLEADPADFMTLIVSGGVSGKADEIADLRAAGK